MAFGLFFELSDDCGTTFYHMILRGIDLVVALTTTWVCFIKWVVILLDFNLLKRDFPKFHLKFFKSFDSQKPIAWEWLLKTLKKKKINYSLTYYNVNLYLRALSLSQWFAHWKPIYEGHENYTRLFPKKKDWWTKIKRTEMLFLLYFLNIDIVFFLPFFI